MIGGSWASDGPFFSCLVYIVATAPLVSVHDHVYANKILKIGNVFLLMICSWTVSEKFSNKV